MESHHELQELALLTPKAVFLYSRPQGGRGNSGRTDSQKGEGTACCYPHSTRHTRSAGRLTFPCRPKVAAVPRRVPHRPQPHAAHTEHPGAAAAPGDRSAPRAAALRGCGRRSSPGRGQLRRRPRCHLLLAFGGSCSPPHRRRLLRSNWSRSVMSTNFMLLSAHGHHHCIYRCRGFVPRRIMERSDLCREPPQILCILQFPLVPLVPLQMPGSYTHFWSNLTHLKKLQGMHKKAYRNNMSMTEITADE
ncbi:uncharacterized protein LOC122159341 [Centrocercus urophasianus]|uniref:uncharacterized protein LOC122159341 n=1 Tax=Centrocercus urophasianus TaxID=9002 RepID=UPI001C6510C7|nr:uncharacterized protein LOC122159341 [Centrocercus urophasianus]